jgi:hypothetical protein
VADAARRARDTLELAVQRLDVATEAAVDGMPLLDVVGELMAAGGREVRLDAAAAFLAYERAVASMRATVVRILIDEDHLSLTDVAAKLRVSRQAVKRLYTLSISDESPG